MKSHPVLVLLLALCVVVVAPGIWEQLYYFHPTPETKSAFLKHYTPQSVIERFQDQRHSSSFGHLSGGGEAGHKFVTYTAGFYASFTMPSEKSISLMNALRDDVSAQLVQNGAQILSQTGDAHDGFHFAYKLGNSLGRLTISLSIDSPTPRVPPFGHGLMDVTARIDQSEKWFPKVPAQDKLAAFPAMLQPQPFRPSALYVILARNFGAV
ncbi:MAG TPA: hypothetical protein VF783_07670 [Terriglobales bacterium]